MSARTVESRAVSSRARTSFRGRGLALEGALVKHLDTTPRTLHSSLAIHVPPEANDAVTLRFGIVRDATRFVLVERDGTDVDALDGGDATDQEVRRGG